jgi:hypothetical protein
MNPDQDDFEQLRRLLALKRHEQPLPGYFETFSHHVISRIEAGEWPHPDGLLARLFEQAPWRQWRWPQFGFKPVLAGAVGLAACSVLVIGLVSSGSGPIDASTAALVPQPIGSMHLANWAPASHGSDVSHAIAPGPGLQFTNGAEVSAQSGSLFDQFRNSPPPSWRAEPEAAEFVTVPRGN